MGFKTEINYILKCSDSNEGNHLIQNISPGFDITITKSGDRTFVLNSPIMIADHDWNILGMCLITNANVSREKTILTAKIITVFSDEESVIVSALIQNAETEKMTYLSK